MKAAIRLLSVLAICTATGLPQAGLSQVASPPDKPADPFKMLEEANTPSYTGGLPTADRQIANAIYARMKPRYTGACSDNRPENGMLIRLGERSQQAQAPRNGVDPDLARLIRALDDRKQEVRDLAGYTISLLGPSAKDALPVLEGRFSSDKIKGGWINIALARVSCENIVPADFRRTIPDDVLPPGDSRSPTITDDKAWMRFLTASSVLMARLYLNEDVEYPPNMMGYAYSNYAIADSAGRAVPLLAQILEDEKLSPQKRLEAAEALAAIPPKDSAAALPALLRQSEKASGEFRAVIGRALLNLRNDKAIPLIVAGIERDSWPPQWQRDLCDYGPRAIAAQDALIDVAKLSTLPTNVRAAVATLGCIKSRKAAPLLMAMLDGPDWQLQGLAALALGEMRPAEPDVTAALSRLAQSHWSKLVRSAAASALDASAGKSVEQYDKRVEKIERPMSGNPEEIVIGGPPQPFDHGLSGCGDTGQYSLDGHTWFKVKWISPEHVAMPSGFPKPELLQKVGTQEFLRVADGWLVGSDGFEGEGVFAHVSDAGVVTHLDANSGFARGALESGDATIRGIVRLGGDYFAFGYQILTVGEAGVLWRVAQTPEGDWRAERILILPSAPWSHAVAPSGELLLSDGPNDYAVAANRIAPLRCNKTFSGGHLLRR